MGKRDIKGDRQGRGDFLRERKTKIRGGCKEFCLEILEEGDTFFSLNFWDCPHRPRCRIHFQNMQKKIVNALQVFIVFHVI